MNPNSAQFLNKEGETRSPINNNSTTSSPLKSVTIEGNSGGQNTVPTVFFNNTTFLSDSSALLTNSNENFSSQNFSINVDSGNLEPIFNSSAASSSRYLLADSSSLSMFRMESSAANNREIIIPETNKNVVNSDSSKTSAKTSTNQQINWNDSVK